MLSSAVDTVLFDLDGTLIFPEPDSFEVISAFCSEIGQPLDAEAGRKGRRTQHGYFVDSLIRDQLNRFSAEQFWRHFTLHMLQALGIRGDLDRFSEALAERFIGMEQTYECTEHGCRTLVELRGRGYKLGLITNRNNVTRFHELLCQMELCAYFDLTLASGEVGIYKPEPDIFYAALERLGVQAHHAIYVGDNYWTDVVGARRAGIVPVLLDPDHVFPEADCLLLERIDELLPWLPGRKTG